MTTINAIPPELVENIIHLACQSIHLDGLKNARGTYELMRKRMQKTRSKPRHLKSGALSLALLCSTWHHIVTSSSRMWVFVWDSSVPLTEARLLLEESCECDIDLFLFDEPFLNDYGLGNQLDAAWINAFFGVALPHAMRWRTAVFNVCGATQQAVSAVFSTANTFEHLEWLMFNASRRMGPSLDRLTISAKCPSLMELYLINLGLNSSSEVLPHLPRLSLIQDRTQVH